jgi:hypothetical protein
VLYSFLDIAFLVLHSILIVFNLFGWAWRRTRRLNLLSILLTVGSWLIFAPWYGLGYCPCTDWHWQVKDALGQTDLPNNYLTYILYAWTGIVITDATAEQLAGFCLTPALVTSIGMNLRDFFAKKKGEDDSSQSPSTSSPLAE